jgi:hypothetical protein
VKAGLEDTKATLLIMLGALTNGQKVALPVESGQWESKESWGAVLWDLHSRGLKPLCCTIADGHLGIWTALANSNRPRLSSDVGTIGSRACLMPSRRNIRPRPARSFVRCRVRRAK